MDKTFNIIIDVSKPVEPSNTFRIYRGDKVTFNFTFNNGTTAFDTSSASVLRVFAKKVKASGVDKDDTPLFAGEFDTITSATFESVNTAGEAGNYLLFVILMDSNSNLITTQGIYFDLIENGYTGIYQPSENFRDAILDAAQQAFDSKNEAFGFMQEASTYATQAGNAQWAAGQSALEATTAQNICLAVQSEVEDKAEEAVEAASISSQKAADAQNAANAAAQSAANAQQISDPENRIGALQLLKSGEGQLYFNGGTATNSTFAPLVPFSAVATVVFTGGASKILTIGNAILSVGADGKLTLTDGTYSATSTTTITQGVPVALTMIVKGTTALVYAGTTQVLSVTSFAWSGSGITVGESGNTIIASRIAVFNFDLSASGVLYSVSDYAKGKDIPPMLLNEAQYFDSSSNWAAWQPSNYSIDKSNGIKVTVTNTFNSSYALIRLTGLPAFMAGTIAQVSYESLEQTVSLDYAMTPDFYFVGTQGNSDKTFLTESGTTYISKAKYDSNEIRITLAFSTSVQFSQDTYIQLNGLKVIINGALIKLGDYTIKRNATTRLIKDESGYGLDATVSAGVCGTKDAAIAAFVDEIKTQINQSNG